MKKNNMRRLTTAIIVTAIASFDVAVVPRITAYILQNYNEAGFMPGTEGYASLITLATCVALMLPLLQLFVFIGINWLLESKRTRNIRKDTERVEDALAKIKEEKDRKVEKEILKNVFDAPEFDSLSVYYKHKDAEEWKAHLA